MNNRTKRVVIAGGAGFLGSHLCEAYLSQKAQVVCLDNLSTSSKENISPLLSDRHFTFYQTDITAPLPPIAGPVTAVFNLASPASPADYLRLPIETLRVGSAGTDNLLALACDKKAVFVLASTSEIYGDPLVHPQREDYWGNVNPIGVRSVYDEAKRFAEALTVAYSRTSGLKAGVARIFNTYGPRLRPGDGRVVSNFIVQTLSHQPLTIYGRGKQTRSFCYVSDLIAGLVRLEEKLQEQKQRGAEAQSVVVNLGNPVEVTVLELAQKIIDLCDSKSDIVYRPLPEDDPTRRCPDISRAKVLLGWEPEITLEEGLKKTIVWFRERMRQEN